MLGDNVEFHRLQELVLEAIMKNKSPILVIIGIEVGKSLLFQLLAYS